MKSETFFYKHQRNRCRGGHAWANGKCQLCDAIQCERIITKRRRQNTTKTKKTGNKYYNYITRRCKNVAVPGTKLCAYHNVEKAEAALGLDM